MTDFEINMKSGRQRGKLRLDKAIWSGNTVLYKNDEKQNYSMSIMYYFLMQINNMSLG